MQVATMQTAQTKAQNALSATLSAALSATLAELCSLLSSFPIQMSPEEREALAFAAISGDGEAEFMVGCLFDASGESNRAMEWYFLSASHDYLPAMLQLFALR